MVQGGLFITLYDEETLQLHLDRGFYGQHRSPEKNEPSSYSNHYRTLADYACARQGEHAYTGRIQRVTFGSGR